MTESFEKPRTGVGSVVARTNSVRGLNNGDGKTLSNDDEFTAAGHLLKQRREAPSCLAVRNRLHLIGEVVTLSRESRFP